MSFASLLASQLVPLNLSIALLLLATLAFIVRWRKSALLLLLLSIGWSLAWSLPVTSLWAGSYLEQRYPSMAAEQLPAAQAIVVLGGHTAGGRKNWFEAYESDTATSRASTAARLFLAKRAPLVIVSGAALDGSLSEAETMAISLQEAGVPADSIILEKNSHTTYENAKFSAQLLLENKLERILLVTSALHMPRAVAAFNKHKLTIVPAAAPRQIVPPETTAFSAWVPSLRALNASRSIIKEYVGLLVYWLRGWV